MYSHFSEIYSNDGNPRYIDGKSTQRNYGTGWGKAKRKALNRDNFKCQICGKSEEELGQKPDVHHKNPVRNFNNPENAHFLENLISLCRSCHMKVEDK